jgi:hypothetical protein
MPRVCLRLCGSLQSMPKHGSNCATRIWPEQWSCGIRPGCCALRPNYACTPLAEELLNHRHYKGLTSGGFKAPGHCRL